MYQTIKEFQDNSLAHTFSCESVNYSELTPKERTAITRIVNNALVGFFESREKTLEDIRFYYVGSIIKKTIRHHKALYECGRYNSYFVVMKLYDALTRKLGNEYKPKERAMYACMFEAFIREV